MLQLTCGSLSPGSLEQGLMLMPTEGESGRPDISSLSKKIQNLEKRHTMLCRMRGCFSFFPPSFLSFVFWVFFNLNAP